MVIVNHNYPLAGAMRIVNTDGDPIEDVDIRIFDLATFETGILTSWVASTISDADGNWVDPVVLDDGMTWVVHFEKMSEYGPKHVEITT